MAEEERIVVIDNGSFMLKAGFSGDEGPQITFPSVIGRTKYDLVIDSCKFKDFYIGDEALAKEAVLHLKYPIVNGIVSNWDDWEWFMHNTFYNELRVDPADSPVIISEHFKNPKKNCEKMMEVLFETFHIPSFYVGYTSLFSLIGNGLVTGLVCEIGDGVSEICPFIDANIIKEATIRQNFAGLNLTEWLQEMLTERGIYFTTSAEKEIVREIKEKHSYVPLDFDEELMKAKNTSDCDVSFTLPDGNSITISNERFRCPELLFKPQINGFEFDGIDFTINKSIMQCKDELHKEFYSKIIVSGGCAMIDGLPERIKEEITSLAPQKMDVDVIATPERKYSTWIGGSIFGMMPPFKQNAITYDEYNESGRDIVHRKCI